MISLTSPVETRAHRWPAGLKLAGLCAAAPGLFFLEDPAPLGAVLLALLLVMALPGRVFFLSALKQLRLLWPFILVVGLWHGWSGEIREGAVIILRLISAVALANLVTMTTRLSDMTDALRPLLSPLGRFGLRPAVAEIAVALTIRLVPVILGKARLLGEAWRARSARRLSWRIILPLTLLALDDAEQVSEALRARGGLSTEKEN